MGDIKMKVNKNLLIDIFFIAMIIVIIYLLYRFEFFIEFFFLLYLLLAVVFFFRFYLNNTAFVNQKSTLQEGIHTKFGDLEAQANYHPIVYHSHKVLHALSLALGFPAVLIVVFFKSTKVDDIKARIYNRLYPIENAFFGLVLIGTIITSLLHHFSYIDPLYTRFTLIIILVILFSYLLSTLLISDKLIETFKSSVFNIRISSVWFGCISFLILFIPSFIFYQGTDEITFNVLKEFNANLIGYKKIRLFRYGLNDGLTFSDILLSLGGFVFSISTINTLKKAFTSKRTQDNITTIASDLNYLEKYKKSLKWLDKVKEEKNSFYWRMKGLSHFGLSDVQQALKYYDRGINQESSDKYALDYKYMRLISESKAYFIPFESKEKLLDSWFEESNEKLFIAFYVILGVGEKELKYIETYIEQNEKFKHRKNIKQAIAFRAQYDEEDLDKIEVFELNSKSILAEFINAYMWSFVTLFSYNENINSKNREVIEVYEGLNESSNEIFTWQLKMMKSYYRKTEYQSVHYLFFLSVLVLKMFIKDFRPALKIKYFNFYTEFVNYLKEHEREHLVLLNEHERTLAQVFDSS